MSHGKVGGGGMGGGSVGWGGWWWGCDGGMGWVKFILIKCECLLFPFTYQDVTTSCQNISICAHD